MQKDWKKSWVILPHISRRRKNVILPHISRRKKNVILPHISRRKKSVTFYRRRVGVVKIFSSFLSTQFPSEEEKSSASGRAKLGLRPRFARKNYGLKLFFTKHRPIGWNFCPIFHMHNWNSKIWENIGEIQQYCI